MDAGGFGGARQSNFGKWRTKETDRVRSGGQGSTKPDRIRRNTQVRGTLRLKDVISKEVDSRRKVERGNVGTTWGTSDWNTRKVEEGEDDLNLGELPLLTQNRP